MSNDDLPAIGRPVATGTYGIVVITDVTGEFIDPTLAVEHHPNASDEHVWAEWRAATLEELVHTWPSRTQSGEYEKARGWWQPTLDEFCDARFEQLNTEASCIGLV